MHVCVTNAQGSGMMSRFYRIMSGVCVCIPESSWHMYIGVISHIWMSHVMSRFYRIMSGVCVCIWHDSCVYEWQDSFVYVCYDLFVYVWHESRLSDDSYVHVRHVWLLLCHVRCVYMCHMIHLCMRSMPHMCTCDMNHLYICGMIHLCTCYMTICVRVTWLICVCVTCLALIVLREVWCVCCNSYIRVHVTCLIHMCDMTDVCMCDRTRSYVWHDSFIYLSCLMYIYDMGWLWLVGSIKWRVSFAKEPYKRDDILQKRPVI